MIDPNNPNFADIDPYVPSGSYHVDVSFQHLSSHIVHLVEDYGLDINPDFQRGPVWTQSQQVAWVEHVLRGGRSGRDIFINSPFWDRGDCSRSNKLSRMVLIDGRQRITAALRFLNNEVPAFGHYFKEFKGSMRFTHSALSVYVNSLPTRELELQWYLQLNSGGTVHTEADLSKVRKLLEKGTPYTAPPIEQLRGSALYDLPGMSDQFARHLAAEASLRARQDALPPPLPAKKKRARR